MQMHMAELMVLCKSCDKYKYRLEYDYVIHLERNIECEVIIELKKYCETPRSLNEIVEYFKFPNRLFLKRHYLDNLLENKEIKMTLPDKPTSKNQKYYS